MRQKRFRNRKVILSRILYFILILMIIIFLEDVLKTLGIDIGYTGINMIRILILLVFSFYLFHKIKLRFFSGKNSLIKHYGGTDLLDGQKNYLDEKILENEKHGEYGEYHPEMRSLDRKFDSGEISEEEYIKKVRELKEKNT